MDGACFFRDRFPIDGGTEVGEQESSCARVPSDACGLDACGVSSFVSELRASMFVGRLVDEDVGERSQRDRALAGNAVEDVRHDRSAPPRAYEALGLDPFS